METSENTDREL